MADQKKRIKELEEITALTSNDYFVVDSSASGGGTKKYKATNITDIIDNIPELVADFEPNHYYDRDALVAHEGKVYYHNAPGASYEEFPTGYQFIQIDLTGLLSRLGFGISIQHNSSFTYNKGDYCMEDYILYRCLNDNVTGAWSSSDWERASLGYDLSSIYKPRLDEHDEQIEESLALGTASGSIATFTDGSTLPMKNLEVAIEPVQDLHGYDAPWVGGSGKNKLPLTVDKIKSDNTSGSWSGNTYSINGAEYKINIDNAGNVTSINARNLASNPNGDLRLVFTLSSGSYILSSGFTETNGTNDSYLQKNGVTIARGNNSSPGQNFTLDSSSEVVYHLRLSKSGDSSYIAYPMIRLASVADATFVPYSNICPISGWDECNVSVCGKNWLPTGRGYDFPYNANIGTVLNVDTDTADWIDDKNGEYEVTLSDWQRCGLLSNQLPIGATTYLRIKIVSGSPRVTTYTLDTDYRVIRKFSNYNPASDGLDYNTQIQLAENEHYVGVAIVGSDKKVIIRTPHIVLNTDEPYEPYNGSTYTITFQDGSTPLTVYGGKLNVTTGVLTVDRAYVNLGSLNWALESGIFRLNENIGAKITSDTSAVADMLCEIYKTVSQNAMGSPSTDMCVAGLNWSNGVRVKDSRYTSVADFKTAVSGIKLVYELATPHTIQLTPTEVKSLLAVNNIFADTGQVNDATYVRNANITINDLIRRIEALENA